MVSTLYQLRKTI